MADSIQCKNCGRVLDHATDAGKLTRNPCPECGSELRSYNASGDMGLHLEVVASGTVFAPLDLLLQTIVVPGERTNEGQLIEAVSLPWLSIIELLEKDPSVAFQIPARKWEEIIAGAYKKSGFDEVTLTPRSGDYGRDVIAVKRGIGFVRVIDQVKAYKPGHLVTADDVRALIGVLQGDGASKGFLTTTSDFAPRLAEDPLIIPFMPSRLQLINGKTLLMRLKDVSKV